MLFSKADVLSALPADPVEQPGVHVDGGVSLVSAGPGQKIEHVVGELLHDQDIHLKATARWSPVQLLEHLLSITGPADVLLTSWTITEEPMRRIVNLMRSGSIRTLGALFDDRAPKYNAEGAQLAQNNIKRLRFVPIHAKCMVLLNDRWGISVNSSANLTRNKRIERYVISTHRLVAEWDRQWIEDILNDGQRG